MFENSAQIRRRILCGLLLIGWVVALQWKGNLDLFNEKSEFPFGKIVDEIFSRRNSGLLNGQTGSL